MSSNPSHLNGMLFLDDAHPLISNCEIKYSSKSGIFADNISSLLKIQNCTISYNGANSLWGGGISVSGNNSTGVMH